MLKLKVALVLGLSACLHHTGPGSYGTQGKCDHSLPSPGCPRYSFINQSKRKDEKVGGLGICWGQSQGWHHEMGEGTSLPVYAHSDWLRYGPKECWIAESGAWWASGSGRKPMEVKSWSEVVWTCASAFGPPSHPKTVSPHEHKLKLLTRKNAESQKTKATIY